MLFLIFFNFEMPFWIFSYFKNCFLKLFFVVNILLHKIYYAVKVFEVFNFISLDQLEWILLVFGLVMFNLSVIQSYHLPIYSQYDE